ncbi:hypothetical protein PCE1_001731 [Barthelona sp. PCE]
MTGNSTATNRLIRDLHRLHRDRPSGISALPEASNLFFWTALIFGPEDSEWEGGIFKLNLTFPSDYPHSPPKVVFSTVMHHPNIYADGRICLDILQNRWTASYDCLSILTSIQSLLTDPNVNSPANVQAASQYSTNRDLYIQKVRECVTNSLLEHTVEEEKTEE